MCNCYETVRREIRDAFGSVPTFDSWSMTIDQVTHKAQEAWLMRFTYKEGKRNKESFVSATYCPFCGEKMV